MSVHVFTVFSDFFVNELTLGVTNANELLEKFYLIVENDIDISFDQKYVWLIKNGLEINIERSPKSLLVCLLEIVEKHLMLQIVTNDRSRIHFRKYIYEHLNEDEFNTFRRSIFVSLCRFLNHKFVIGFLVERLDNVRHQIDNYVKDDSNMKRHDLVLIEHRILQIINELKEKNSKKRKI